MKKAPPTRRGRIVPCLAFVLLKALCSLVVLNFYIGTRLSLEDDVAALLRRDFASISSSIAIPRDRRRPEDAPNPNSTARDATAVVRSREDVVAGQMITPRAADGTLRGKERLWAMLTSRNATMKVEASYWDSVPTWDTVVKNIHRGRDAGSGPVVAGLETCEAFRNATAGAPARRRMAPAGLFNTGTNLLSVLLEFNCQNPHRVAQFKGNAKRGHGNEWEVPWGKHNPAAARDAHFTKKNLNYGVDDVLPIVLVRDPFGWMKSMCRHPYAANWDERRDERCPRLAGGADRPVAVRFGSGTTRHRSLAHLWNDWYGAYFRGDDGGGDDGQEGRAPFPRLFVRFEDLIFYPEEVTRRACACAGGVLGHRLDDQDVAAGAFHYVVRSAKAGAGHGPASQRNGLVDSWIRYGGRDPRDDYAAEEARAAEALLDPRLVRAFGYG